MKRFIILLACFCSLIDMTKSQTIIEALKGTKIYSFPYDYTKASDVSHYEIGELAKKIPIAISYKDLDATIRDNDYGEEEVTLYARFSGQDGRYYFHVISNFTDRSVSEFLVLMNTDGTVSDYLWVGLFFPSFQRITPMDFQIDKSGIITVYQINSYPNKGGIDPYDTSKNSFTGQRTDKSYEVVNGKFVLKSTTKYHPCSYKLDGMDSRKKRIWYGYGLEVQMK